MDRVQLAHRCGPPGAGDRGTYEIANGVYADWRDHRWVMRSMADSTEISELVLRGGWYGFLSPDGRYLRAFPNEVEGEPGWRYEVFEVATGRMHPIGGPGVRRGRLDSGRAGDASRGRRR